MYATVLGFNHRPCTSLYGKVYSSLQSDISHADFYVSSLIHHIYCARCAPSRDLEAHKYDVVNKYAEVPLRIIHKRRYRIMSCPCSMDFTSAAHGWNRCLVSEPAGWSLIDSKETSARRGLYPIRVVRSIAAQAVLGLGDIFAWCGTRR